MQVIVQVPSAGVDAPHREAPATPGSRVLERLERELGIELHALHPDSGDSALRTSFSIDIPDGSRAQQIVEQLRRDPAVSAAYIKPPEALP